jgi:MFS family permease
VSSFGFLGTFKYLDYLTIVAAFIGALNLSVSTQLLSRLLLGFAVGINTIIIPTYLTSCLPGSMGGPAGTLNQLFITIGILFGYLMGFSVLEATMNDFAWRAVIALPIIPCVIRLYTSQNVFPYETVEMMI